MQPPVLGDFAHSSDERNQTMRALMANFPGSRRVLTESAPFLSAYGRSAVVFDDDELQGLYVLAEADVIGPRVAELDSQAGDDDGEQDSSITSSLVLAIRSPFARLRRYRMLKTCSPTPSWPWVYFLS